MSGIVSGRTVLAGDHQTIVFVSETDFVPGETIAVGFHPGSRMSDSMEAGTTFQFHISSTKGTVDQNSWIDFSDARSEIMGIDNSRKWSPENMPVTFPNITTAIYGPTAPGKIYLANLRFTGEYDPYLMILENSGQPLFYRALQQRAMDFTVQPNGLMTYYDFFSRAYLVMDSAFQIVDTIRCGNGYSTDPHELRILSNGNALLMSYDPQIVDMSRIVPRGDTAAVVTGLIVQELDVSKNVVFQWRSWDHFEITDAVNVNLTAHTIDYVHGNAIEVDWDGNLLVSCRHMDEITKINRTTGDILWRWGGRNNQFTFVNDTLRFKWQHAIRRIGNGNYTLFDNGVWRTPQLSRAVEYELDESAMTATVVWEYRQAGVYGGALGYVQRLSNGNTLIGWGSTTPTLTEVTPDGFKVYELSFDIGMYSYRAYRHETDFSVEVNRAEIPLGFLLSQNYPNPFNSVTTIRYSIPFSGIISLKVYDLLGREVLTPISGDYTHPGEYVLTLDASGLSSGIYFYRLDTGSGISTRAMLLMK